MYVEELPLVVPVARPPVTWAAWCAISLHRQGDGQEFAVVTQHASEWGARRRLSRAHDHDGLWFYSVLFEADEQRADWVRINA